MKLTEITTYVLELTEREMEELIAAIELFKNTSDKLLEKGFEKLLAEENR